MLAHRRRPFFEGNRWLWQPRRDTLMKTRPWSRNNSRRAMPTAYAQPVKLIVGWQIPAFGHEAQSGRVSFGRLPHFEQRNPSLMGRHRDLSGSAETSTEATQAAHRVTVALSRCVAIRFGYGHPQGQSFEAGTRRIPPSNESFDFGPPTQNEILALRFARS
jgi:hypothetical protein